ncbi:PREDICTED: uncharacterized protein LOC107072561 [Polistes dominula]|uniref:Uncharacterized protein LOC107072561 n=1 Tax=Polistes dominula TaxID=743375 RepID=A0ABM1J6J8_POLDO|nr:PREDICTED: uncharacterized protein LOC107072561 [Polistes dominula]
MSTYINREHTDMILSLGTCGGNASAAANHYRHQYRNRQHPDRRVIQRAEQTLDEYGSFEHLDDMVVVDDVVQGLMPHDKISQKAFCHWLLQQHTNDAEFLLKILWTDKNLHSILETHFQVRWNVNVWAGIIGHLIIGPYFFEGNVTSVAYFDFLQHKLPELLEDVPLNTRGSFIFQQDGASSYFSRHMRDFLNQHYQGWIGGAGTIAWPQRSPDLTPLDFYLWSHIKSIVYSEEITSCEQLREKIIVAFHTLKQSNTLESVHRNLIRRAKSMCSAEWATFSAIFVIINFVITS